MTMDTLRDIALRRYDRRHGPLVQHLDPPGIRLAGIIGAVMWTPLLFGSPRLHAQVAPTVELRHGRITNTIIRNPSQTETLTITVELLERLVVEGHVTTGRAIGALISPARFTLSPGTTQTVRIRLKEPVPAGQVLAYVVTFTPLAEPSAPGSETTAVARLVLVTRIVAKAVVQ